MADYNEWNCAHGIHAGEWGACEICTEEWRKRMVAEYERNEKRRRSRKE